MSGQVDPVRRKKDSYPRNVIDSSRNDNVASMEGSVNIIFPNILDSRALLLGILTTLIWMKLRILCHYHQNCKHIFSFSRFVEVLENVTTARVFMKKIRECAPFLVDTDFIFHYQSPPHDFL